MNGLILRAISGFYYVKSDNKTFECKAKGAFRKDKIKPLVGDNVEIEVTDLEKLKGNVTFIYKRKNELYRPVVANIDQALIVFSITKPNPDLKLLDKLLVIMKKQNLPCIITFSKQDLDNNDNDYLLEELMHIYSSAGYFVTSFSSKDNVGIDIIKNNLEGKVSVICGPSGVGKTSLINILQNDIKYDTGEISVKLDRGKNTTRHSKMIEINQNSYIVDTPGFTLFDIRDIDYDDLKNYYPEFIEIKGCYFNSCNHVSEPNCEVKNAVEEGKISAIRYNNYLKIFQELKDLKKY